MNSFMLRATSTLSLLLLIVFHSVAQTTPPALKIAVINSLVFQDANNGVTKLQSIKKTLEAEYKSKNEEVKSMQGKLEAMEKQIQSSSPYDQKKVEEYENLNRQMKLKIENYQAQYQKRYNELINPVYVQMEAALKDWCKKYGYNTVVDVSKDDKGMFVWVEESIINQNTIDLVKYINAVVK